MDRTVLITNIPAPYRVLQFNRVSDMVGDNFCVLYCAYSESNRKWESSTINHDHIFLNESVIKGTYLNIDVISKLRNYDPDVVIGCGFSPTIILSFIYCEVYNKKFIGFTDSWLHTINRLSLVHILIRKLLIPRSDASICVGNKGRKYCLDFGADPDGIFVSPIAIDNDYYSTFTTDINDRYYDLIYAGRFVQGKMPEFIVRISDLLMKNKVNFRLLIIGDGKKKDTLINKLKILEVDYSYPGFIQQEDLPKYYSHAKLLLFPTQLDAWGVVTNEACAVGTPVITCDNAGAADDLIINNQTGFVLPLDIDIWVDKILYLLQNEDELKRLSRNCEKKIKDYSLDKAAKSIIDAIEYVGGS